MPDPDGKARMVVTTHPDSEIFLIGNDRQVVARGVGELDTRQPRGLYRLKVTRAAALAERIIELDGDISIPINVLGLDSIVPFSRTMLPGDQAILQQNYAAVSEKTVVLLTRVRGNTSPVGERTLTAPVRIAYWRQGVTAYLNENPPFPIGEETWSLGGIDTPPGMHVLELDYDGRRSRQSLIVLPGWQTRVFLRRQPPGSTAIPAAHGLNEISLHLAQPWSPLLLPEEYEPSETTRWALAMGRRIVRDRRIIDIFLNEKFFDPMAGLAAAHLMFDALEGAQQEFGPASLPLDIPPSLVAIVMSNLDGLLSMPADARPDLVALKLRAKVALQQKETSVTVPPVFARSWETLVAASVGAKPSITIAPEVFRECAANFSSGPYFGWTPTNIANFVEHLVANNLTAIEARALAPAQYPAPQVTKAGVTEQVVDFLAKNAGRAASEISADANISNLLTDAVRRGLTRAINNTEWMRRLGKTVSEAQVADSRTATQLADAIVASATAAAPAVPRLLKGARKKVSKPVAKLVNAALSNEAVRSRLADQLNIPRSLLDMLVTPKAPNKDQAPGGLERAAHRLWDSPGRSHRALEMIVRTRVENEALYAKRFATPGYDERRQSVMIGIGYDLGLATKTAFLSDWKNVLSPADLVAVTPAVGLKGRSAADAVSRFREDVSIAFEAAEFALQRTYDRVGRELLKLLPNARITGPDCVGALVSLCLDRGLSFSRRGDEHREMRSIKLHIDALVFSGVPSELRSMRRLQQDERVFQQSRDEEAELFERALESV